MKLGAADFSEVEIVYEYGNLDIPTDWIMVYLRWPYFEALATQRPEWFRPTWHNQPDVKFFRLDCYRALKLYASRPEWAGMTANEFIERSVTTTP